MVASRTTRSKPFLSVVEAAALLGESKSTIYRSIAREDFPIPVVMINGRLRIPRKALDGLVDGYSTVASEPAIAQAAPPTPSSCTRPSAASPASRSPRYSAARRSSASTPSV
jgi:excisionase family DNA binding protein